MVGWLHYFVPKTRMNVMVAGANRTVHLMAVKKQRKIEREQGKYALQRPPPASLL
jgi:hypothetical protein